MQPYDSSGEKNQGEYLISYNLFAGSDAEIKNSLVDPENSSEEDSIGKASLVSSHNVSQTQMSTQQDKQVLELMKSAIRSGNADQYALAFDLYRKADCMGRVIIHPVLDDIVLNCKCNDKILMKHFESKSGSLRSIANGFFDNDALLALIDIQSAIKVCFELV